MPPRQIMIEFLLDQMSAAGPMHARQMFGAHAIYHETKVVAFVFGDQLFVKPTEPGRALIGTPEEASPCPGLKPHFVIAGDRWDDSDWLSRLISTTAAALPMPKPPRKRRT